MLRVIRVLIELASQVSTTVAIELAGAVRVSNESREKKELLENCRHDHIERLQAALACGLSVQQHNNSQAFIQGLGVEIARQNEICLVDESKVREHQVLLQQSERKRLSYIILCNRASSLAKKLDDKREQKATDEFASRKYATNLSNRKL